MFVPDDTFMIVNWLDSALTVKRMTVLYRHYAILYLDTMFNRKFWPKI